tara:strand:- start:348 stop:1031 length:684 start_codon:yes stop_codon:yes gene_type:complete
MSTKSVTIILILSALFGCKLQKDKPVEVNGIEGYRVGDAIRTARFLNSDETIIAKRVCRDLRSKRNRWEINRDNLKFNFNIRSRTSCSGGLASYALEATVDLASGDLMLETPSRSKFISEVLTDHHTAIQNICDEVLAGESEVENTVEISGTRFQSTFYEYQSGHFVLITRFLKDTSGVWKAALVDESRVIVTERTSSSDQVGVVDFRAQEAKCSGSGTTYINQSLR